MEEIEGLSTEGLWAPEAEVLLSFAMAAENTTVPSLTQPCPAGLADPDSVPTGVGNTQERL